MLLASDSDEAARKWVAAAKSLSSNYNPINSLLFLPCNSKLYSLFASKTTVKKPFQYGAGVRKIPDAEQQCRQVH